LFAVFAVAVGWHRSRGRRFGCGCGTGGTVSWTLFVRDMVLSAIAGAVAAYPRADFVIWLGPGWIRHEPTSLISTLPVAMTFLLVAAGFRLIQVSWALVPRRAPLVPVPTVTDG
jgi:hypothetical protein